MTSRLTEFRIDGLFGLYSHRIPLNHKERITIIIGPNGRGKTVCLKLIEALFRKRYAYFLDIPFRFAEFLFTGGETIKLVLIDGPDKLTDRSGRWVEFLLSAPGQDTTSWAPPLFRGAASRELRRYIPAQWQQIGPDLWVDRRDGEEVTLSELADRHHIPPKILSELQSDLPEFYATLINNIDCHLIEAQRLLILPPSDIEVIEEDSETGYVRHRRTSRVSRLAIQQKAQKLRAILKDTLASYATLSQSLDRSFPLRVFDSQGSPKLPQDQLRLELKQLDERRDALMAAGILDTDYRTVTMRSGNIEPGVAMALEIYVKDAVQKLNVFNDLRARLDLFKELIETRFLDKTLHIDRESGFKITSKNLHEVPLDKLSSGEQHQLILVFDLLFEVNRDSLILIDEPELSLHVAWQKTFIQSLSRIIELNGFDVLLATHSSALVARYFSLAVELGPVDE
jgi:predicted ATPase